MLNKLIILLLSISLFCSCARIVTPNGGPKDVYSPKVIKSSPEFGTRNFHGNRIDIHFDEYIVLDNASGKLLISPPLKHKPTVGSKLKTLYVKDIDSLEDNTTYIFDFGDAITDYTEGNRLSHYSFMFSTGNNIDTMFYSGRVLNAYTLKPVADKYVGLYFNKDKQSIRENLPSYITRTDSNGRFFLEGVRTGVYSLVAFEDLNQNRIFDLKAESFAYKENVEVVGDTFSYNRKPMPLLDTIYYNEIVLDTLDSANDSINKALHDANKATHNANEVVDSSNKTLKKITDTLLKNDTTSSIGNKPVSTVDTLQKKDTTKIDYGVLILNIKDNSTSKSDFIVSFFDDKNKQAIKDTIIKDISSPIRFDSMVVGKYGLRFIVDRNHNGVWDRGNFDEGIYPEKVILYKKDIIIKDGWETEEDISLQ